MTFDFQFGTTHRAAGQETLDIKPDSALIISSNTSQGRWLYYSSVAGNWGWLMVVAQQSDLKPRNISLLLGVCYKLGVIDQILNLILQKH